MLRPATLLRPFTAPSRLLGPQSSPPLILARRCMATTPSSTASDPLSSTPSTEPTLSPATSSTQTPEAIDASNLAKTVLSPTQLTKARSASFYQLRTQAKERARKARQRPEALPYHVFRTPSNQLAVYHLAKRGGNKKLTSIKKVEGDRTSFRAALARDLGVEEKGVTVNNLTGHVIVPGHRKSEVLGWLEKQGF